MSIAIIAALPRELSGLVKGWERREVAEHVFVWTRGDAVVACAGMGAARGVLACEAAMRAQHVTRLISGGIAGACDEKLRVGEVVRASEVVDAETGERFEAQRGDGQVVATGASIAGVREKRRLKEVYDASAVDMEGATVARMARAHGLEFRSVKAISDEADFEMDGLERFATADGQFREGAFALHAAVRPWMWGKLIALGWNSIRAVNALTKELVAEIDWYRKQS